jgi:hypothetical protein
MEEQDEPGGYGMRIYLAGPMRGIRFYNFPAFDAARDLFTPLYEVISPADMDRAVGFDAMALPENTDWMEPPPNFSFEACVERDLEAVRECDALYMLDGWATSRGACAEHAVGVWMGKTIFYQTPPAAGAAPVRRESAGAVLPEDAKERKGYPLYRGLMVYFPRALAAVAHVSFLGNEQHHPGTPLHWDKSKSGDHEDALLRHLLEYSVTGNRVPLTQVAWRALAALEMALEEGMG